MNRSYRKRGIATEILKSRKFVLEKLGLKVTASDFSVLGSQKAAKSVGFEDVYVIR